MQQRAVRAVFADTLFALVRVRVRMLSFPALVMVQQWRWSRRSCCTSGRILEQQHGGRIALAAARRSMIMQWLEDVMKATPPSGGPGLGSALRFEKSTYIAMRDHLAKLRRRPCELCTAQRTHTSSSIGWVKVQDGHVHAHV